MATFRYGGKLIKLEKNKHIIGVKMRAGFEPPRARGLDSSGAMDILGGFQLMEIPTGRGLNDNHADDMLDTMRQENHVLQGTHVFNVEGSPVNMVPTGELYIVFRPWASTSEQREVFTSLALTPVQRRGKGAYVVKLSAASPNPISCTVRLQENPLVAIAEPDLAMSADFFMTLPDDPYFQYQWHLKNTGKDFRDSASGVFDEAKEGADAKVVEAWEELGSLGSSAVVMAIIDNGFDLDHPDFDGRGRTVHPWDFVNNSPRMSRESADTHGTLCAGVALAGTNGTGIVGVAPNSRFMPIRNKELSDFMIEMIFERVVDLGADIVSCSWGRPGLSADGQSMIDVPLSTRQREAVVRATREGRNGKGCVVLFAAGNNNRPVSDFCRLPEVIAVGASTSMDERADYSNFGPTLSILGPSGGRTPVISTFVTSDGDSHGHVSAVQPHLSGEDLSFAGIPDEYRGFAGTSCSCPVVAGVCALILSANPELSSKEVKDILEKTADKIGEGYDTDGHADRMGYGRVNALEAVLEAKRRRRTPARPPIETSVTIQHELEGRLYNENDYRIFHLNLDSGLEIEVSPSEGTDAEFEINLKRGSRPDNLEDHDPRHRLSPTGEAHTLQLRKVKDDDYYLIVKAVRGAGDFKVRLSMR